MKRAIKNGYVLSVIGAVLVGGVLGWLLLGDHGSAAPKAAKSRRVLISLRRGTYPPLGLMLEQPTSWLASAQGGLLTLSSPDAASTTVAISAPGPAGNDAKLRPEINGQLMRTFQPAKVIARRRGPIGKVQTLTTAIIGTSRAKRKVLILSTALSSPYRTYSIQVLFKSLRPSPQSQLEVRSMLGSIRFFAPQG